MATDDFQRKLRKYEEDIDKSCSLDPRGAARQSAEASIRHQRQQLTRDYPDQLARYDRKQNEADIRAAERGDYDNFTS